MFPVFWICLHFPRIVRDPPTRLRHWDFRSIPSSDSRGMGLAELAEEVSCSPRTNRFPISRSHTRKESGNMIRNKSIFTASIKLFSGLIVVLALVSSALAQGTRGAISGTVRDENGAAVPGAQVEVINSTTGVTERTATSDDNGNFGVTQLPPGDYKLVVSKEGFSKAELPDVRVRV